MKLRIECTRERLSLPEEFSSESGGVVRFTGIVRGEEAGQPIAGLEYEGYQPMAQDTMLRIFEELHSSHPIHSATVLHRLGFVPVGEAAIILEVSAAHREEAFQVAEAFMNRLKQDVPIWKIKAVPL
jgi:molybdopterin synthase catalytic subunit